MPAGIETSIKGISVAAIDMPMKWKKSSGCSSGVLVPENNATNIKLMTSIIPICFRNILSMSIPFYLLLCFNA